MIAVDTSALMAIVLDAPEADICGAALAIEDNILISAGTIAEALIVASQRGLTSEMASLIDRLGCTVISVTLGDVTARGAGLRPVGQGQSPGKTQLQRLLRL